MKRWPFVLGFWFFIIASQLAYFQSSSVGDNFWVAQTVFLTGMTIMGAMYMSIKTT